MKNNERKRHSEWALLQKKVEIIINKQINYHIKPRVILTGVTVSLYGKAITGGVVAQWIRPRTLNRDVNGSNLLAAAEVPSWARHFIIIA